MSEPYIGEIRMFAGDFAPVGWALCNGDLLLIAQNSTLFSILGTTYGGNGVTTFALPDLRGRLPVGRGPGPGLPSNRVLGQAGGAETVALTTAQSPSHSHTVNAVPLPGNTPSPAGAFLARSAQLSYAPAAGGASAGSAAAGASHMNTQPSLAVSFIIALEGIFPSAA
jgi:microcystin-dependent protein